uniref:Uncharacterized protein n=1 Tax=Anopheles farauti TaxID=69004 RepID=A0A182QRH5_9DIPT
MPPQILPQILGSSGTGKKMQSRDHPFNRSTRPLLSRAQPQILGSAMKQHYHHQYGGAQAPSHHDPLPKIPTTRGYNDFNLISRQYSAWNSNHSHSGYPYGSPPSPTADIGSGGAPHPDFQFSDIASHHQRTLHKYTVNSNNSDDDDEDDYDELVYHHNQLNAAAGPAGLKAANQQLRRRLLDAASPTPPPVPPQRTAVAIHHKTPPPPPRRTDSPPSATNPAVDNDGPFVFGVHHPNTFTPAYGTAKAATTLYGAGAKLGVCKDATSPDSSQHSSSDTSSCEKSRRALVKEKKNSKRTKSVLG